MIKIMFKKNSLKRYQKGKKALKKKVQILVESFIFAVKQTTFHETRIRFQQQK